MLLINIIIIITVISLYFCSLVVIDLRLPFRLQEKNLLTFFSLSHTKIPVSRSFDKKRTFRALEN